jgi:hypothetical protein
VIRLGILARGRITLLSIGLLASAALPAWAQKTDVVTLLNGDRFTCEVKLLDRGRLEVSTDNLGTVYVEWDKIASVVATRTFQVETTDGLLLIGQLTSPRPGSLDVVTLEGTVAVEMYTVVYIAPIGLSLWSKLDGSLDMGLSYTQSSGVAQVNLSSSVTFRRPNLQMTLSGSNYFTHQEDENTSRQTLQFSSSRSFKGNTLWLVMGGFESNEELGYDLRSSAGAGLGHYLVRSNRAIFALGGGLSVNKELPVDGDGVENLDAFMSLRQSYFTYDFPKTNMTMLLDVYPSLSQWGRIRLEFNGSVKREIIHDFTVGLTIYDSYDNKPPTEESRKNDVGLSLTVGWTF